MQRMVLVLTILVAAATAACDVAESTRVEQAVLRALGDDPRTAAYAFDVSYQGEGQVVITGELFKAEEADIVTEIAQGVGGVNLVVNRCHVEEYSSGQLQDMTVPSPFF